MHRDHFVNQYLSPITFVFIEIFLSGPKLTPAMVFNLSMKLTNKSDIRLLAMVGLQMQKHVIDKYLHDETDITEAAYRILDEWSKNQRNSRKAYNRLCEALTECNMSGHIELIQMRRKKSSESSDCEK